MSYLIKINKIAKFNYEITQTFEAGVALLGWEVKSIKQKNVDLKASFCTFKKNELFINNMHIDNYMSIPGDQVRARKLLLTKGQLKKIFHLSQEKSIAIVPISIFINSHNLIKINIGIGRGKKNIDKRETIKKLDQEREARKIIKGM